MSTKSKVLHILESQRGKPVSGQELAEKMGISRTAINKAVKSLRKEGFPIAAAPRRGYTLSDQSDVLSVPAIRAHLNSKTSQIPLELFRSVTSTNDKARELATFGQAIPSRAVVVANEQTAGRGRLGRSFYSPADTGIYMSFLIKPEFDITHARLITTAAAAAVASAIESLTGFVPEIKWVNDVYLHDKKICGILTEAVSDFESGAIQYLVVGIGINCSTKKFPKELEGLGGSISEENEPFFRNALVAEVINQFIPLTYHLDERSYLSYYRAHSMVVGKDILVYRNGMDGTSEGQAAYAKGIDNNGGLMVVYGDGTNETLATGEISIRLDR